MGLKHPVSEVISFSWKKTQAILFPFELKRWVKILFIVWLAGHAAGLGSGNNISKQLRPRPKRSETAVVQPRAQNQLQIEKTNPLTFLTTSQTGNPPSLPATKKIANPSVKTAVFLLGPAVLGLMLFFLWLSTRFDFVLLDLVVRRDISIKEAFQKYKSQGNSYFKWLILFFMIGFGLTALLISGAAFVRPLWGLFVFLVLVFVVAMITVGTLIGDFVLPVMYQDNIRVGEALKKFLSLKPCASSIALYLLVKVGLGIASGLIIFLAGFLLSLGVIVVGLLIMIFGSFLVSTMAVLKPILVITGVLLLTVTIFCIIILWGLMTLPIPIFFRVFALAYLGQLIQGYNLLGFSSFSPSAEIPRD